MANNTNPSPIMPFTEYNTFQGFYKIRPADEIRDLNYVFNKSILHVTDWLRERFEEAGTKTEFDPSEYRFLNDYPSAKSMETENFDVFAAENIIVTGAGTRFDIDVLGIKDFGEWAMRIFEPNNKSEADYADRLFTTDIAIKKADEFVFLAIKTTCTESLLKHEKKAGMFRPVFLRYIVEDAELIVSGGNLAALKYPINIARLNIDLKGNLLKDEYEFLNVIFDSKRLLPVVFCPASSGYDKLAYARFIRIFSWNMSGEAYVITDEHGDKSDCYKGLFEKMYTNPKYDILKRAKIPVAEAMARIKDNYLVIYPPVNGICDIEWHAVNEEIKNYSYVVPEPENEAEPAPDAQAEAAAPAAEPKPAEPPELPKEIKDLIKDEVHRIRDAVGTSLMARREASGCADIDYGDTSFYSELWNKYVDKSDSKTIENLNRDLEEAKKKIDEIINDKDSDTDKRVAVVLENYKKDQEKEVEKLRKTIEELGQEKRAAQKALEAEKANNEATVKKLKDEYETKFRTMQANDLEARKLDFFLRFMSVSYDKKKLLEWVEKHMSDEIAVSNAAKNNYGDLLSRLPDSGTRLRDAFIALYAFILNQSDKEKMPDDLYEAIKADKRMSAYPIEPCGDDAELCKKHYGHTAAYHIPYSSGDTNYMFRLYFEYDESVGKYLIVAVVHHVPWS